jgi:glycosyltransferase involved in cell wall biosynthesis
VSLFVAPSYYFANLMQHRLELAPERLKVVHNGINLEGYRHQPPAADPGPSIGTPRNDPLVLGYFARMCREKGLPALIEAFIEIRARGRLPQLKLHVGGSCGPADELVVEDLRARLANAGLSSDAVFLPNPERSEKIAFLHGLSAFCVPALYGEAFGLYLLEALAAGVPVVQPRTAAFPELVEATGGGVLCAPDDTKALADAIESLLLEPGLAQALGAAGRKAVFEKFSAEAMTRSWLALLESLTRRKVGAS